MSTGKPKYPNAKLILSALKFYEGDKSEFNTLVKSPLKPFICSLFKWFLVYQHCLHYHRWALFDHMTALSKKDRPFYEFEFGGVKHLVPNANL